MPGSLAIVAGVLTFSKSFMILLFVIVLLNYFIRSTKTPKAKNSNNKIKIIYYMIFFSLLIGVVKFAFGSEFSEDQMDRVIVVFKIISGDVNGDLTTGRSALAAFAFELIERQWLLGYGFGYFTDMVGSESVHHGVSQGVHNHYLRVWGESGFFIWVTGF